MNSVKKEALSLTLVISLPLSVFCFLPYGRFLKQSADAIVSSPDNLNSFVLLTAEQEQAAMKRAKTTKFGATSRTFKSDISLILSELPDDETTSLIVVNESFQKQQEKQIPFSFSSYLPSLAAPSPNVLETEKTSPKLPFPREELMTIE